MSKQEIECAGLPCPQPVIKCKKAIESEQPATIVATVDNEAAKENVSRFLGSQGYETSSTASGDLIVVTGVRADNAEKDCPACAPMSDEEMSVSTQQKILVFIPADVMGSGDDDLGGKLMYNFLLTLKEMGSDLWRIVMVNSGVKLATAGNQCAPVLKELEESRVSILVCGTCLEHFSLTDAKEAGEITNMLDIITSFQLATKTIRV